ncbi:hypothetical protein AUC69_13230 [Methyloceanibacter superfactus]|uniref:Uncharacterized protein n=1 Tax=Methyloceanibacter superfactus TaxID=1774969 RepID=A0A1E3VU75_9HYPH|nr:hypothetical protein AUC69_13230 [Methyloceanibacter superfactus]
MLRGFLLEQRLAVGDRNLVIVGVDFSEGQEAVAIAAVVDESRLERRLYARDFGKVNIASELLLIRGFVVKLLDAIALYHDDPGSPDAPHRLTSCLACCVFSGAQAGKGGMKNRLAGRKPEARARQYPIDHDSSRRPTVSRADRLRGSAIGGRHVIRGVGKAREVP